MGKATGSVVFGLRTVDTLFFRSGRPFNQDDPGAALAESLFPPHPPTVVGAVRAALAGLLGWSGRGAWSADIVAALGNGDALPEGVRVRGPYLMRRPRLTGASSGQKKWERLFPAPACLVGKTDTMTGDLVEVRRLRPSPVAMDTDLGPATLPVPETFEGFDDFKPLADRWLAPEVMLALMNGDLPDPKTLVKAVPDLWHMEQRVGIARDIGSRRVQDGALYMATHVRLNPAPLVELALVVEGLNEDVRGRLKACGGDLGMNPLGGENRSVWLRAVKSHDTDAVVDALKPGKDKGKSKDDQKAAPATVVAVAQTPVIIDDPALLRPGAAFGDGLTIRAVSAGKATAVGGWDSINRRPRPQRPVLPAGTVWHLDNRHRKSLGELRKSSGVGARTGWGFGEVVWCADIG